VRINKKKSERRKEKNLIFQDDIVKPTAFSYVSRGDSFFSISAARIQ